MTYKYKLYSFNLAIILRKTRIFQKYSNDSYNEQDHPNPLYDNDSHYHAFI